MKELYAVIPILFESKQYRPGDPLPTHNPGYVAAWVENKTAEWREKTEKPAGAKRVSAPAGVTGKAIPQADPEADRIGIPPNRGRATTPKKGRKKDES